MFGTWTRQRKNHWNLGPAVSLSISRTNVLNGYCFTRGIWRFPKMGLPQSSKDHLLVVGFSPPLWKIYDFVSWAYNHSQYMEKIKLMFQTTNQIYPTRFTQPGKLTGLAIDNGHRNSWFTHSKWWFSIVISTFSENPIKLYHVPS